MEDQPSSNTSKQKRTKSISIPCTICGYPSRGLSYGGAACEACKTFFKRNAKHELHTFQCHFDGHCEININTRHTCTYCRLAKCFANGMQREFIRCPYSTTSRTDGKLETRLTTLSRSTKPAQIPTLNLLQRDQSTLTVDQWNILSNLSHCYDDHAGLSFGERYMSEQHTLPPKLRFRITSILDLFQRALDATQSLYKNNGDFLSLSTNDRSILLHGTLSHTASISANFIVYKIHLLNQPAYYEAVQVISPPCLVAAAKRLSQRLDFDTIVMKFLLAILSFSTFRYTIYSNNSSDNFSNIQRILHIQDRYIEVIWRYLLYKYNHQHAVKCFSDFIRCLFVVNEGIVGAEDVQWFTDILDSVTEKAEQNLIISD